MILHALLLVFLAFSHLGAEQQTAETRMALMARPTQKALPKSMTIETIFGTDEVTDAVVIELLHHKLMTRLHGIDQHGPPSYFCGDPTFSRYDHSLGVYALLKRFGASLTVQVAGLLHDASHTVFSHLADRFFKTGNEHAYQDQIHSWFLEQMGVDSILKKYGMSIDDMMPEQYNVLKGGKCMLSADRIQYNLHTGLIHNRLTQEQVDQALNNLRLDGDTWYFTNQESARLLADQSVYFTRNYWGSPKNTVQHHWMVSAMKQLVARDLVSSNDIHFGQDQKVIDLFEQSTDRHIVEMIAKCKNHAPHYQVVSGLAAHDIADYPKFRGINPPVEQPDGSRALLTDLDAAFKEQYDDVRSYCQRGIKIKFVDSDKS